MSIATVLWLLAVSGLVTGVAGAFSAALRRLGRPERWVWIVALLVTAALPFLSGPVSDGGADAGAAAARALPIAHVVTLASSSLPETARTSIPWIPILWSAASLVTVVSLLGGAWTLARRRERWPRRRVDGDLLRVSDTFGPAVVGWIDPEIVLPAWALQLEARQRRLILRHENEHRWARDPQLLGLGIFLLAAAPWNPLAWLQFRGLRRAVEFDCDARVLDSGASPRAYGRLLLSVQMDGGRGTLFAPALREPASFLERRLETMKLRTRPIARARAAGLTLVAAVLAVVACETPRPTEVTTPPDGSLTATTSSIYEQATIREQATILERASSPLIDASYAAVPENALVVRVAADGRITLEDRGDSRILQLDQIEAAVRAHVETRPDDEVFVALHPDVRVGTVLALQDAVKAAGVGRVGFLKVREVQAGASDDFVVHEQPDAPPAPEIIEVPPAFGALADMADARAPLIYVDGVLVARSADPASNLRPQDIDRIEVVKGEAAIEQWGADAANGVIQIFTKND